MTRPRYISLMLALVTLLVYLPVWHHRFVVYDDPDYVIDNRMVQAGLTWAGVKWAFTTQRAVNWHPITWLSHMLDAQLFGTGATGPHMVNALIHVANTILLFHVLQRLSGALWRSALVAALFALHPLHVESVAWAAERKDVLSGLFFLLTLWAYTHYTEASRIGSPASTAWYGCALSLFALGLMSKPMLVTLPFVLLLLDYWPLRRWEITGLRRPFPKSMRVVWEKVPFFLLSALSSIVTFVVQKTGGAVQSTAGFPMSERIENALVSYARYLGKTFWPIDLAVFYPHPRHWPEGQVVFAAILVAGVCLGVLWFGRRVPFAVTGWFWFFGMMIPTIGLVQVGSQSMADRYTYLPLIGVFMIFAWGLGEAVLRWRLSRTAVGTVAGLVVVACAVRTEAQLRYWQDSESLFGHALAVTKGNSLAHSNLGLVLFGRGQVDEAIAHFQMALEIQPDYADAHSNLGHAFLQIGRVDEAIAQFQRALEIQPERESSHYNLGTALIQKGQVDEAIAELQKALEIRPDDADAHYNLGAAYLQEGQVNEAIVQFQKTLEIRPDDAEARNNLGNTLLKIGRVDEAIRQFQAALRIQPGLAPAHHNLAVALIRKGAARDAIAQYQSFLELQPDNARALADLAWILATWPDASMRNGPQAIDLAQRATELSGGRDPAILRVLAAAYAENVQMAEAVSAARRALELAEAQSNAVLADALRSQINLYQAGSAPRKPGPTDVPAGPTRP